MEQKIKNFKEILFLFLLFSLSLISCRENDSIQAENKEIVQKFQFFQKQGNTYTKGAQSMPDQEAFRALYYYYYIDNPNKFLDFKDLSRPHIDFRYASQVFIDEDSTRKVLYPFIEDGYVSNIIVASVSKENDRISFYFPEQDEDVKNAIAGFSETYRSPGFDLEDPALIEPVVIPTPPKRNYYLAPTEPFNPGFPLPPSGGCGVYNNCGGSGGGGGGGSSIPPPTNTITPPPPPEKPIADIKKFLSCLNINQSANLKVYAQTMQSSPPGHAFISITQGNNIMVFGFYPSNGFPQNINGPSTFANDGGHAFTHSWNIGTISPIQLQQIIAVAHAYSSYTYDVSFTNCADFTLTALSYAGISTNTNGIDTPNTVANLIGGSPTNGTAPSTNRTCN